MQNTHFSYVKKNGGSCQGNYDLRNFHRFFFIFDSGDLTVNDFPWLLAYEYLYIYIYKNKIDYEENMSALHIV